MKKPNKFIENECCSRFIFNSISNKYVIENDIKPQNNLQERQFLRQHKAGGILAERL